MLSIWIVMVFDAVRFTAFVAEHVNVCEPLETVTGPHPVVDWIPEPGSVALQVTVTAPVYKPAEVRQVMPAVGGGQAGTTLPLESVTV